MGRRAQKLVEEQFAPEQYAVTVTGFMEYMEFLKPLEQLTSRIIGELSAIGATADMPVCKSVADTIQELFQK